MPAYFDAPSGMNAEKLMVNFREKFDINLISQQYTLKSYFDSFDWRLWRQGMICEFARTKTSSTFSLIDRKQNKVIDSTALFDAPTFAHQLNPGKFRKSLEAAIEMRALLTIGTVECEVSHFDIYDEKGKVLLRLILEEFVLLSHSLSLLPFKADGKFAKTVENFLVYELGFAYRKNPALVELLNLQGRQPKDYSSKVALPINKNIEAQSASKTVLLHLLKIIKHNEPGVIADTDIEFLHDYRIAIRKTRVALKQFKALLPAKTLSRHIAFFNWLGQITSETRDMDVYLLNFEPYQKQLPKHLRASILPLQQFLQEKKARNHKLLAQKLRSKKYKVGLEKWHDYLTATTTENLPTDRPMEIKDFADRKIWKLFKQVKSQADGINPDSPPPALHTLRKKCKKLRYLLEFFQEMYPENKIKNISIPLKNLQKVLGIYQDLDVQHNLLERFATQTQTSTSDETAGAIELLVGKLDERKVKILKKCSVEIEKFNKHQNHKLYKHLFQLKQRPNDLPALSKMPYEKGGQAM